MQLTKLISLLPLALSVAAMATTGGRGLNMGLAAREAEAEAAAEAYEDNSFGIYAREAEAEPIENDFELEARWLRSYMKKRDLFKRVWCPDHTCQTDAQCIRVGCNTGCNGNGRCLAPMIQPGPNAAHGASRGRGH